MNELTLFAFEGNEVRTIQKECEPWFAGKDVCAVFGDSNHNRSLSRVFGEDKTIIEVDTPAGIRSVTFINETGLYDLLFSMQPQKYRIRHAADRQDIRAEIAFAPILPQSFDPADIRIAFLDPTDILRPVAVLFKNMRDFLFASFVSQINVQKHRLVPSVSQRLINHPAGA